MTPETAAAPRSILRATLIALLAAALLLVTVVLPSEFGLDPLKTGRALGLLGLAPEGGGSGAAPSGVRVGVYTPQAGVYRTESEDYLLRPGNAVEMKYHMKKGAAMVYSWKADGKLRFEFHGEPDQKPNKEYYESYEKDDKVGRDSYYGSFIAPTTGIHGWFWENKTQKEIRFHLSVAGFFENARMYVDGIPEEMPLQDAPLSPPQD